MDQARRDELRRAVARARSLLQPGDRITFTSCPGTKRWAIFTGFVGYQGLCIASRTRDDISALSITKVNGIPTDFSDARGMPILSPHDELVKHLAPAKLQPADPFDDLPF